MNLKKDVAEYVVENFQPIVAREFKTPSAQKNVLRNLNSSLYNLLESTGAWVELITCYGINGDGEFFVDIEGNEELL